MEHQDAQRRRWLQLVAITGGVGILMVLGLRRVGGRDTGAAQEAPAPADRTRAAAATTSEGPERTVSRPDDDAPEPTDDASLAVQPQEGEAWSLLRVPLVCQVEPVVAGPPVVGDATPVTWPGPDHDPQPDGLVYPAVPMRVTVGAGELTGTTFLPVVDSGGDPTRHVARLVLPGFAPTRFSFVTTGPDQPATCDGPVQLVAAAGGVVGVVRFEDGSPAEGAIVDGCGTRVIAGSDGTYFLLPRAEGACSLRARHAPGSAAESALQSFDPLAPGDHVLDFVVAVPDQADPGVEIFRTDDGEVWGRPEGQVPWSRALFSGARILRVGDVPADELSDEELLEAMVRLDQPVHVEQYFETEDGESVRKLSAVDEL